MLNPSDLAGAKAHLGTEVVLEGAVVNQSASKTGDVRYLNFNRNFRNSISLVFFVKKSPDFSVEKLETFVGKQIRVRGVVEEYKDTLQIKVQNLSQIEVLP